MMDVYAVTVDQGRDDLSEDMYNMDLNETALFMNITEQLAAFNEFHDEVATASQILYVYEGRCKSTYSSSRFSQMSYKRTMLG